MGRKHWLRRRETQGTKAGEWRASVRRCGPTCCASIQAKRTYLGELLVLAHMEHDGTHDPVRKLVLYGMAHADSPREVLPEGDHCKKQPVSVVSKSLKSLLLRRKLDDSVQFFCREDAQLVTGTLPPFNRCCEATRRANLDQRCRQQDCVPARDLGDPSSGARWDDRVASKCTSACAPWQWRPVAC